MQTIRINQKDYPFVFGFSAQIFALEICHLTGFNDFVKLVEKMPFNRIPELLQKCIETGISVEKPTADASALVPTIPEIIAELNRRPMLASQLWDMIGKDITPENPDPKNSNPRTTKP